MYDCIPYLCNTTTLASGTTKTRTKQALKGRINQHQRPSNNRAQNSAVFLHIKDTGHLINFRQGRTVALAWHKGSNLGTSGGVVTKQGGLRFNPSHAWDRREGSTSIYLMHGIEGRAPLQSISSMR